MARSLVAGWVCVFSGFARPISVLAISMLYAPEQRFGYPDAPSCGGYTEIGRSG